MSNTVNPTLEFAQQSFKSLVWDGVIDASLSALFVQAPYLNVWPLRQIITGISRLATDKVFAMLKLTVDLQAIVFLNTHHKAAFDNAFVKLKILARDKGIDSPEFKKAKEDAKIDLARFLHFNG